MSIGALDFEQRKALWLWCDILGTLAKSPAYEIAARVWPDR
jgi:hypothetical protein